MAKKKKSKEELEFEKNFTEEEKLQIENDLLKLKIETEIGGELLEIVEKDLPPEIENEILNQVYTFYQKMLHATKVRLYEYIGTPEYIAPENIKTAKEFTKELKRLVKLMKKKGVDFNIDDSQTSEVLYRFIVDELFELEIDDIKTKGSRYFFDYEDFHPNVPKLLERFAFNFLRFLFSDEQNKEVMEPLVNENILLNSKLMSNQDFFDYLTNIDEFLPSFESFALDTLSLNEIENICIVEGDIQLKDMPSQHAMIEFQKFDNFWQITSLYIDVLKSK